MLLQILKVTMGPCPFTTKVAVLHLFIVGGEISVIDMHTLQTAIQCFTLSLICMGALPSVGSTSWVDFYWHPTSPLPSGQAHIKQLYASLVGVIQVRSNPFSKKQDQSLWLQDLDLSRQAIERTTGQLVTLSKCDPSTCWIVLPQSSKPSATTNVQQEATHEVVPLHRAQLNPWPKDLGIAVTWKDSTLLTLKPTQQKAVAKGERFSVIQFLKNWAYVISHRPPYLTGYLPLQDIITKYHLAEFALWQNHWHRVETISSEGLQLHNVTRIVPFAEITAVLTHAQKRIASDFVSTELPPRSTSWTEQEKSTSWFKSFLPEHGFVYWKKPTSAPTRFYTATELINRGARFIAQSSHEKGPILISHNGVFFSSNKKDIPLQRLDFFGEQTWPVHIDSSDRLYVGYWMVSAQTLPPKVIPLISWQILTRFFENQTLPQLRLVHISTDAQYVLIDISSGRRKWRLAHPLQSAEPSPKNPWVNWQLKTLN